MPAQHGRAYVKFSAVATIQLTVLLYKSHLSSPLPDKKQIFNWSNSVQQGVFIQFNLFMVFRWADRFQAALGDASYSPGYKLAEGRDVFSMKGTNKLGHSYLQAQNSHLKLISLCIEQKRHRDCDLPGTTMHIPVKLRWLNSNLSFAILERCG